MRSVGQPWERIRRRPQGAFPLRSIPFPVASTGMPAPCPSASSTSAVRVPRHMHTAPDACLHTIAPSREGPVVAVECMFTGYWLADRRADHGRPCVLGPAFSMTALQGGPATNATIDAQQLAALRRGGRRPQASGAPAARRATRALLRRRLPLTPPRAARLTPVQTSPSPVSPARHGHTARRHGQPRAGRRPLRRPRGAKAPRGRAGPPHRVRGAAA